ncbi:MAG: hypothetical protein LBR73_09700 [Oscillospiraceae bacterium]|jgi:hypothetical protein|nr:hypothetical protein [Oscillospiraceae bacterium]
MKRTLALLLALLLSFALFSCGEKTETADEPTSTDVVASLGDDTTEAAVDPSIIEESTTEAPTATEAETTTEAPTTTEAATTTALADVDPTTLDKAGKVEYFNAVVNKVRTERPAFDYTLIRKIDSIKTTIVGGFLDGIINPIVKSLMPGDPENGHKNKGDDNTGEFLSDSEKAASLLKSSNVSSITITKSGDGYEMTVKLGDATNPSKTPGNGAYASLHVIEDLKGIINAIVGENGAIKAPLETTKVVYNSGYATVKVNGKGQVTSMTGGFKVDAVGQGWSVIGISGDVTAYQSTEVSAQNFVW